MMQRRNLGFSYSILRLVSSKVRLHRARTTLSLSSKNLSAAPGRHDVVLDELLYTARDRDKNCSLFEQTTRIFKTMRLILSIPRGVVQKKGDKDA